MVRRVDRSLIERNDQNSVRSERGRGHDLRHLALQEIVELTHLVAGRPAVRVSVLALVGDDEVETADTRRARRRGVAQCGVEGIHVVRSGGARRNVLGEALARRRQRGAVPGSGDVVVIQRRIVLGCVVVERRVSAGAGDVARDRHRLHPALPGAGAVAHIELVEEIGHVLVARRDRAVVLLARSELAGRHGDIVRLRVVRSREVVRQPGRVRLDRPQQEGRVGLRQLGDLGVLADDHEHVSELRHTLGLADIGGRRAGRPSSDHHTENRQQSSHPANLPTIKHGRWPARPAPTLTKRHGRCNPHRGGR